MTALPTDKPSRLADAEQVKHMLEVLRRVEKALTDHNEDRRLSMPGEHCDWDFGEGFGGTIDAVRAAIAQAERK